MSPKIIPSGFWCIALILGRTASGQDVLPRFTYSLAPSTLVVAGPPGAEFTREFEAQITTSDNPTGEGIPGWTVGVTADGVTVAAITTKKDCSIIPNLCRPGLGNAQVGSGGVGECEGKTGAVSNIILSVTEKVTLPPEGTSTVAWITVRGKIPSVPGESTRARVYFADGCRGSGQPAPNLVIWMSTSVKPEFTEASIEVRAVEDAFRRGEANRDGTVDIADALTINGCLFFGDPCPGCRDAADGNDDGAVDVSDVVTVLSFLFLGGYPPPAPGPHSCDGDPTSDSLPDCTDSGCPGGA